VCERQTANISKNQHYIRTSDTLRYGLKRFLNDSINVDISDSRTFPDSNKMFHAVLVDLKKKGFGKVDHKPPITKEDLTRLYSGSTPVFYVQSPTGLLNKVWFELMLHLCRRGEENLRGMSKSTFEIVSEGGRRYVQERQDEMDKNHRETSDDSVTEGRMYDLPGIC